MTNQKPHRDLFDFADAVNRGDRIEPETDLEHTYARVNRAMQANAMPGATRQQTWENVMTTLALHPQSNRTRRQRQSAAPQPRRYTRWQWTPLANVALVAVLLLASFGAWQSWRPSTPPTPPERPVAGLIPGTAESVQIASPETVANGCVAEGSIPVWQGTTGREGDGAQVWLTLEGTVTFDCGNGQEQQIGTNINYVTPIAPNVVEIHPHDYPNSKPVLYNLVSGETLEEDVSGSSYMGGPDNCGNLGIGTFTTAPGLWSVVNYETMEARSLNELTGGQFPSSQSMTAKVSRDGNAIVIGTSQYETEGSSLLNQQSGLPGELAVISADFQTVSWVEVPDGMAAINNISISPDASKIALISSLRSVGSPTSESIISVIDVSTNTELVRTDTFQSQHGSLQVEWAPNDNGLYYVSSSSVVFVPFDGSEIYTVYESDMNLRMAPRMRDVNTLFVTEVQWDESTPGPDPLDANVHLINMDTNQIITIPGQSLDMGSSSPDTFTIGKSPLLVRAEDGSTQGYDPMTGEPIEGLTGSEIVILSPEGYPHSVSYLAYAQDAPVSAVLLGGNQVAVVDYSVDTPDVRTIDLPTGMENAPLMLSPDGTVLMVGNSSGERTDVVGYQTLDLTDPNSTWVDREIDSTVTYVVVEPADQP